MTHQSKVKQVISDVNGSFGPDKSNAEAEATNAEGEATHHEQLTTNLTMSRKNYCFVCGLPQTKISRHLKIPSKTHAESAHAFSFPDHSKERKS